MVKHIEDGQEIAYKGPYSLCCQFFDNSNCTWVGEYPNNTQVGGCPIPRGPWKAAVKRPLWIRLPGTFRARLAAYSESGALLESVETVAVFQDSSQGPHEATSTQGQRSESPSSGLAVLASDDEVKREGEGAGAQEQAARRGRQGKGGGAGVETKKVHGYGVRGDEGDGGMSCSLSFFVSFALPFFVSFALPPTRPRTHFPLSLIGVPSFRFCTTQCCGRVWGTN